MNFSLVSTKFYVSAMDEKKLNSYFSHPLRLQQQQAEAIKLWATFE